MCDGQVVRPPPSCQGLLFLNIASYMGGVDLWGGAVEPGEGGGARGAGQRSSVDLGVMAGVGGLGGGGGLGEPRMLAGPPGAGPGHGAAWRWSQPGGPVSGGPHDLQQQQQPPGPLPYPGMRPSGGLGPAAPQSSADGVLEVVAVFGAVHLGQLQVRGKWGRGVRLRAAKGVRHAKVYLALPSLRPPWALGCSGCGHCTPRGSCLPAAMSTLCRLPALRRPKRSPIVPPHPALPSPCPSRLPCRWAWHAPPACAAAAPPPSPHGSRCPCRWADDGGMWACRWGPCVVNYEKPSGCRIWPGNLHAHCMPVWCNLGHTGSCAGGCYYRVKDFALRGGASRSVPVAFFPTAPGGRRAVDAAARHHHHHRACGYSLQSGRGSPSYVLIAPLLFPKPIKAALAMRCETC